MPESVQTKQTSRAVNRKKLDCASCGLYRKCKSPRMKATGLGEKGILVIAEGSGFKEDELGTQLIGKSGQVLRKALRRFGIDLDRDCRKMNAINCRATNAKGENRPPDLFEISCCRSRVWKEIEEFKPKLILLLGKAATQCLYEHRYKKNFLGIMALRGWHIPDRDLKCWVCPTFHPSFVMRSEKLPTINMVFEADIKNALKMLEKEFPKVQDDKSKVTLYKEPREINNMLEDLLSKPPEGLLSIDYEASGLKLHKEGHFIRTCAMAWKDDKLGERCVAFTYSKEIKHKLICVLNSPEIKKTAHNIPYEEDASRAILNQRISAWTWDSMMAAHYLDNRTGIIGLKFQVFVRFGVVDYASHLDKYIESEDDKDGNSFNRIGEASLNELLTYNGLDSLYGLRLANLQRREIGRLQPNYGYSFMHEGIQALIDIGCNGVHINEKYCQTQIQHATRRIKYMEKEIFESSAVKKWKSREGNKFNLNSNQQLQKVLFEDLKLNPTKFTDKNNASVDKDALDSLADKAPFVRKLVEVKEMKTARDVYLKGWLRESVNGLLHPMFSLSSVRSYRSSCSKPNLQNVPVRDEGKHKMLRTAIIPSPGNQLVEADYKRVEVSVAACYTKDPVLIKECKDTNVDMHRDTAMELFKLPQYEVSKGIRHTSKNGFVFPEFYGDYYKQVAPRIWETMEKQNLRTAKSNISLREHLANKGINTYEKFESHVQEVEDVFWNVRFKVYNKWKWDTYNDYLCKGYLDTLTGFRCSGPLDRKQICNYPIQCSAFHCLLWSLIRLNKIAQQQKWKSKLVLQIHDSVICDLYPPEKEMVIETIKRVTTKELPEQWPWIIVPLQVDMEITGIDEAWYYKKNLDKKL